MLLDLVIRSVEYVFCVLQDGLTFEQSAGLYRCYKYD